MTFIVHWSLTDEKIKAWQAREKLNWEQKSKTPQGQVMHRRDETFGTYELEAPNMVAAHQQAIRDMGKDNKVVLIAEKDWLEAI
jgi:hypothetical protein